VLQDGPPAHAIYVKAGVLSRPLAGWVSRCESSEVMERSARPGVALLKRERGGRTRQRPGASSQGERDARGERPRGPRDDRHHREGEVARRRRLADRRDDGERQREEGESTAQVVGLDPISPGSATHTPTVLRHWRCDVLLRGEPRAPTGGGFLPARRASDGRRSPGHVTRRCRVTATVRGRGGTRSRQGAKHVQTLPPTVSATNRLAIAFGA
jgi:hypothetical protein